MLAEAVAAAVPAASHMEPRAAQKAVRLNAKTKTEVSEKSKSAFKMARWRAARKAAHEAATAARAGKNALKRLRKQASGPESEAVSPGGSPLVANGFINAVAQQLRRPGASRTEFFEFQCKPLRQFQTWFRQKALPSQKFTHCAEDMRRALRFPWPMSVPEVRVWLFALVGYWWLTPYGRDALGYELLTHNPDWHRIGSRLQMSASGPRAGMSGTQRLGRSGPGAVGTQQQREVATLQCGHDAIVRDGLLEDLTEFHPGGRYAQLD